MKIAHITTVHTAFDIRIYYKECMTLAARKYDLVLIAPYDGDNGISKVRIRGLPKIRNRFRRMIIGAWAAYKAAIDENVQICHLHDPELLLIGQLLRLRGKVVIFDMHENVPASISDKEWIPRWTRPIVRRVYSFFERILLRGMYVVYAENSYASCYPHIKDYLVVLNYPFSRLTTLKVGVTSGVFSIGYIGGVSPNRGAEITIKALKILDDQGINVTWHCIGGLTDDYRIHLHKQIEQFRYVKVRLYGAMKPEEGWKILAGCDVGLAVLQPIGNYLESYPTKIFEYMALGIPVITSDFDLYKRVIEVNRCGRCVDPRSAEDIAKAIQWYSENRHEAEMAGSYGKQAILEKYNWELEGKKLIQFYETLIAHSGS